jgi:hypothetical protein
MCLGFLILMILVAIVLVVYLFVGVGVGAVSELNRENEEIDLMSLEDLEDKLVVVREQKEITYGAIKRRFVDKEVRILGAMRKHWQNGFDNLSLEQLEQNLAELPTERKLGSREIAERQEVIAKVIENRRKLPKEIG